MSERSIQHPKIPTLYETLLVTQRRRLQAAWNLRHHPDPNVPQTEEIIATYLAGVVNDVKERGKEMGIDPRRIPIEIFPRTSLPHSRQPSESTQLLEASPTIEELLKMPREEAIAKSQSSGILIRYIFARMNISQPKIAELLYRSVSWIDKMSRGLRPLNIGDAHMICDLLNIAEEDPMRIKLESLVIQEERARAKKAREKRIEEFETNDVFED